MMKKFPKTIPLLQFTTGNLSSQDSREVDGFLTAESWLHEAKHATGIYMHIPFCFHKCHYCDFFSIANAEDQQSAFIEAILKEIKFVAPYLSHVQTIFIGGGTPTLLQKTLFKNLLQTIAEHIPLAEKYEWTVESNPETVTHDKANFMKSAGVNRVSIGAQSFNEQLLEKLERWHSPGNVKKSVDIYRKSGIENINLDLIYAIPTQTIADLKEDLRRAVELKPKHLSCYALTYEPNTPLAVRLKRGEVLRVNQDCEAEMFQFVRSNLDSHGYAQYEISNFAQKGFECEHNLLYWNNKNWWPIGPAAAGHIKGLRWRNQPRLTNYLTKDSLPLIEDVEHIARDRQLGETCMLGLRMTNGLKKEIINQIIESSPKQWRKAVFEKYIDAGYLHWTKGSLAFTDTGLLFADTVIVDLLMQEP
mgnify:CR=1 FL=1